MVGLKVKGEAGGGRQVDFLENGDDNRGDPTARPGNFLCVGESRPALGRQTFTTAARLDPVDGALDPDSFRWLHAAWCFGAVLSAGFLYVRPKPRVALVTLVLMHSLAFLGYYAGLARPYAIGVSSDRSLGVGMALAVAQGGSPFNHVQVEFGNLEPLWTFTVAALSGFSSDLVPWVYDRTTILVLALTAAGFYRAWSKASPDEERDAARWRGVFVAASVLGLSSSALSAYAPILPFWPSNFVFKPNHALAFGLVGLLSRWRPSVDSWLRVGALMGLLFWVFILDWAYFLPGIFIAAFLGSDRLKGFNRSVLATSLSLALGLPYLRHLLRDYNPAGGGEMPQIWRDQMGDRLKDPYWWSLDLGLLLALFALGLFVAARRSPSESGTVGFLLSGPLVAAAYVLGLQIGFAPEPDEGFYYFRLVVAAGAGYALWFLAQRYSKPSMRLYGPAFGLVVLCSFPASFNPIQADRYFRPSIEPLPDQVLATASWMRENTLITAVMISSEGIMLSGLTGRRFLMVRPEQTADRTTRERAERDILTSLDEATVRRAARRYGVTHVIIDGGLREKYGDPELKGLGNRPWFEPMFVNSFARIVAIRKPD